MANHRGPARVRGSLAVGNPCCRRTGLTTEQHGAEGHFGLVIEFKAPFALSKALLSNAFPRTGTLSSLKEDHKMQLDLGGGAASEPDTT